MHKWFFLTSVLLASPDVAPVPIRRAIADHPFTFGGLAVAFAVFGGLAVQHRQWINGKVTIPQAVSEVVFSAIAGFVAYWLLAKGNRDQLDLCVAALLAGMAGRPLVVAAQAVASRSVLQAVAGMMGVSVNDRKGKATGPELDTRRRIGGDDRDGGREYSLRGEKSRDADGTDRD